MRQEGEYIKTYVSGLDERMEGGIPKGHIVLISGPCGSMKTTFAFNIVYHHVLEKRGKGGYITFEQSSTSLLSQMKGLRMDIEKVKDDLAVVDLGWLRKALVESKKEAEPEFEREIDWFDATLRQIKSYKDIIGYDVIALDSLEALSALSIISHPRNKLFHFFEALHDLKLTTLIVTEMQPDSQRFGGFGVESFLADGIIHLAMERVGKTVGRFLRVVKMREVNHPTDYFPLIVDRDGFKIVTK
jgi:KaiC/GvpD/RAD55 family RecA-like ATPase